MRPIIRTLILSAFIFLSGMVKASAFSNAPDSSVVHTWQMKEIVLKARHKYHNYYTDVTCWVDLKGPGFSKRIYGFWDGGNTFRVRVVATRPGVWKWTSGSNQPNDSGLDNHSGSFRAIKWTTKQKQEDPNRHGFVRATPNEHALEYADGTPFFLVGDTWLAGSTWRLPFRNAPTSPNYVPSPGIGFEDAVAFRKKQGFNSVSMISCFPNWDSDWHPATYADSNGIYVRNAWEKFGYFTPDSQLTAKNMRDEYGNRPFSMSKKHPGVANFNRINPAYFQSLDKKMKYLSEQGFVPMIETVRRDMGPTWAAYFNFNKSFARFFQYLISRYGAYNVIFSGIHLDWIPKKYSLTARQFNEALTYHWKKYGPPPFGQLVTALINNSTYKQFGNGKQCPWLTMQSVGNKPRNHGFYPALNTLFRLDPPHPAINLEPYYAGWNHEINMPGGERPPANSPRDNYFCRAQMYGSVLSGGLSGHVYGTAAYDITTTGEPAGARPHFWTALKYKSATYMQYLHKFILSEGAKYRDLKLALSGIHPSKAPGSKEDGLDGWSYMMRTPGKDFALLYFENKAVLPQLSGFKPNTTYELQWYDTMTGKWLSKIAVRSDAQGNINMPDFPDGHNPSGRDWAARITEAR